MSICIVSAKEFADNLPKYIAEAHRRKVVIAHGGRFLELGQMDVSEEKYLNTAGIGALVESGD